MELRVLGPVEMSLDGARLDLGTPKQRALIAALALSSGRPVSVDVIVDLLWGDEPPPGVTATLQAYVSGLRKVLEPQRERRAPATVLVTAAPGYALRLPDGAVVDASAFEQEVAQVHRLLTDPAPTRNDLEQAVGTLDRALARWTGDPYAELGDAPAAVAERARLAETRLVAAEDRAVAQLALGHHATVVGDLESLTTAHPLRERLWALRALALARSGRQGEALDVLRQVRQVLDDELGIDPGAELRELQDQILRQDPALSWTPPPDGIDAESARVASPWPMVGRERPKEALLRGLDAALAGNPSFAAVTGEPGIGKSRLVAEMAADAQADGATVVRALSSSDEGAPPLWPWRSVLTALDTPFPQIDDDDGAFAVRGEIVAAVLDAARLGPVVLVLEDLHWADPASLRVLLLLAETVTTGHLFVVATWRDQPEPTGLLADVAEAFARRHALRLALTGLSAEAVADVVAHLTDDDPDPEVVEMLRDRTAGNPFFVVEYARLAADRGGLGPLLAAADTPRAVHDVLTRRVDRLPEPTVAMLTDAAVLGRRVDGETLAALADTDPDAVLEALEPAMAAGLVVEDGIDRYSFAHALVRDTLYDSLSASRRARRHVAAARVLAGRGRAVEEARHWLAAGPAHAATAWRAAVAASGVARDLHAHEETAALLGSALTAMDDDPEAAPLDRYDVLMARADAYRWSGRWVELTADIRSAIDAAREVGDTELVLLAATSGAQGALWQTTYHGEVDETLIAALREGLAALSPEPSPLRCRATASLAGELYYAEPLAVRRTLVDEALAMATEIDDPALTVEVMQIAAVALWTSATAHDRIRLAEESARIAAEIGRERDTVLSMTLAAVAHAEAGRPDRMRELAEQAMSEAQRLRLVYAELVLSGLIMPWLAMGGRTHECEQMLARVQRLHHQASIPQSEQAMMGAVFVYAVWNGSGPDVVEPLIAMARDDALPMSSIVGALLCRIDRVDDAREYVRTHPVDLDHDDWFSMLSWCNAAEVAMYLKDPALAADVLALIAPFTGHSCSGGSGNASGPVDSYIAYAHVALGDTAAATAHADRAMELCEQWEIPLVAQRLRDQRDQFGF